MRLQFDFLIAICFVSSLPLAVVTILILIRNFFENISAEGYEQSNLWFNFDEEEISLQETRQRLKDLD